MKRRFIVAVWLLGFVLSAGWAGLELYRISLLKDWSIPTVTLLLFWLFAGRRAWGYLQRELRRRAD